MSAMPASPELRSIASAVVKRYEGRLRQGHEPAESFFLRIAPSDARFRRGRPGVGGYDPRDVGSVSAFESAVDALHTSCGCAIERARNGELKGIRTDARTVEECFEILGAAAPWSLIESLKDRLVAVLRELPPGSWARAWVERELADLDRDSIGVMRRWGDVSSLDAFLSILRCYSLTPKPMWKRVLSIHACGDSKTFESEWQTAFIGAAKRVGAVDDTAEDAEALFRLGFLKFPSFALIAGEGDLDLGTRGCVSARAFGSSGVQLPDDALIDLQAVHGIGAVLVAENETNFHALASAGVPSLLVVYGGGQPNSATMALLRRFDSVLPSGVPICAWSDIDLGGFEIVSRIMDGCPRAQPLLMDACDFDYVYEAGFRLVRSPEYVSSLESYLTYHPNSPFSEVCERCVSTSATIEQEAMLSAELGRYAYRKIKNLLRF